MNGEAPARDPYLVKAVVHASRLLSAFRSSGEALPLREIASRSGLPKSMAFRLLYTLERCGMVDKVGENLYRCSLRPFKQKLYRLGYAAQGTDYTFSKEVSLSLERAAAAEAWSSSRWTTGTTRKSPSGMPTSSFVKRSISSSSSRPTSTSPRLSAPSTAKPTFR
jgi:hypothetical protein